MFFYSGFGGDGSQKKIARIQKYFFHFEILLRKLVRLSDMKTLFCLFCLSLLGVLAVNAGGVQPCRIEVVEKGSLWPVPLVELRSTHHQRFVSDNRGLIAMDSPDLMGKTVYFEVVAHGYEVPKDGFGIRGVRLQPKAGETLRVEVERKFAAKRLGRLTGAGLFAESQKLGLERDWQDSGIFGCDSVQSAVHRGKKFWAWGDTTMPGYVLGIFHMTGATTPLQFPETFEPPLYPRFDYFRGENQEARAIAKLPGEGPTWVSGVVSLKDAKGESHLVGQYIKVTPPLEANEAGLCVWNEQTLNFESTKVLWKKTKETPKAPAMPEGHPIFWRDEKGKEWLMFGNPFPTLRCEATLESWQDPGQWEIVTSSTKLEASGDQKVVEAHSGSMGWSSYRKKWIAVFVEKFGKPSVLGEVWYVEGDSPMGPWGKAVKVLSHENYTFYNPRLHLDLTPDGESFVLFEGTYTHTFSDRPQITPRYDYNQILYRLDLNDPKLKLAQ